MKMLLFKYSVTLVYFLSATVLVLLIAVSLLYGQITRAQHDNRALILQNDSIISEHIRLRNMSMENTGTLNKDLPATSISLSR